MAKETRFFGNPVFRKSGFSKNAKLKNPELFLVCTQQPISNHDEISYTANVVKDRQNEHP